MIYTVTFNPSIDYIVNVDNFMTGVVNRTSKEIIFPGGKGINVSMVLKNLGEESTALGFMAGFTGDAITRLLQEKGVTADFIHVTEGLSRINVKLRAQTETEINGQGPKIASEDIRKLYGKLDALQDGDTLVLAGSIPDTMPESMYMDIMEHLQNKKLNIVVDATRDLLMNVLAYHPFLIKPNRTELGNLFYLFQWNIPAGTPFLILYGLFSGIFLGGWIMALAEMADIFPIFARRIRFQKGLSFTILCVAFGKAVGSLIYYYNGWLP